MGDERVECGPPWPRTVEVPLGIQLHGPDFNADVQMLIGLGAVVRASSQLEFGLRSLFCALEGSKYAAITAAGQSTDWLLGMSEALLKCNVNISHKHRITLTALLTKIRAAMQERNRYVHDVWAGAADGATELMRSRRKSHVLSFRPVTIENLIQTSQMLMECAVHLTIWIGDTLGIEGVGAEAQLRWEDYLNSLSPEELAALLKRRSAGKHIPL